MSVGRHRLKIIAGLLLASCASSAVKAQTEATPPASNESVVLDDAEALAVDAKLYAAEFGVSFDEAVERLTIMIYGSDTVSQAAAAEGTDLAGRYFDNNATDFGLVVATKKAQATPKTVSFVARTRENYGRLTAESRRTRNQERQAGRRVAKLSDAEVAKAEDMLGKPVTAKIKYKVGSPHSLGELIEAVNTLSA